MVPTLRARLYAQVSVGHIIQEEMTPYQRNSILNEDTSAERENGRFRFLKVIVEQILTCLDITDISGAKPLCCMIQTP